MKRLAVSFSGGETSGYMVYWLKRNKFQDYDEVVITFANTGQENEETLVFVDRCDKEWGLDVVWLEAMVNPEKGKGTKFKRVTFETADRDGRHFEEYIKKHGIPNITRAKCTDELKLSPMRSYLRSIGWKKGEYDTAIGIRVDEMDRVSSKMQEERLIYPLIEHTKATKEMIKMWWDRQPFQLGLEERQGNCKWCWKKSRRKLLTLAADNPEIFEFPARMEALYGFAGPGHEPGGEPRVFFRDNTSTLKLLEQSKQSFVKWTPKPINFDVFSHEMDAAGGCSESCEVY